MGKRKMPNNEMNPNTVRRLRRTFTGIVSNCYMLNVRSEANADSKVVDTLREGSTVNVVDTNNGWYKIDKGYVMADFITIDI